MAPMDFYDLANQTLLQEMMQSYLDNKAKEKMACQAARFMANLSRPKIETIYWCMVVVIMGLVIAAARVYSVTESEYRAGQKDEREYKEKGKYRELTTEEREELNALKKRHSKIAWHCLYKTLALLAVATVADAMQVLAILSLQHCHKELLLGLYWPLWTLLGLGSSIAMCGVVISQIYSLKGHEPPKYTIALGTPVLVVSACGDFVATEVEKLHRKIKRTYTEERSTLKKSFTSGSSALPIAQANTLGEAGRDLEAGLGEEAQIGAEAQTREGLQAVASPSKKP